MINIYLDEDVHKKAAYALRLKGFDVLHASEANKNGLTDTEQLEYAISLKRTIFTFNVRDFIILHKKSLDDNKHHYGIIVSPQVNLSILIKRLSVKILSLKPEEIYNQIYWL